MEVKVSWFDSKIATQGREVLLSEVVDKIRSCKYSGIPKVHRPAFTPNCTCTVRRVKYAQPNGVVHVDVDKLFIDAYSPVELRNKLAEDERVLLVFISPSRKGVKVFGRYDVSKVDYKQAWGWFKNYIEVNYGVKVDEQAKDITRLCFVGDDDNAYYNVNCKQITFDDIIKDYAVSAVVYAEKKTGLEYCEGNRNNFIFNACVYLINELKLDISLVKQVVSFIMNLYQNVTFLDEREVDTIIKSVVDNGYNVSKKLLKELNIKNEEEEGEKQKFKITPIELWHNYLTENEIKALCLDGDHGPSFVCFLSKKPSGIYEVANIEMVRRWVVNSNLDYRDKQRMLTISKEVIASIADNINSDNLWKNNFDECYLAVTDDFLIRITKDVIQVVDKWEKDKVFIRDYGVKGPKIGGEGLNLLKSVIDSGKVADYVRGTDIYDFIWHSHFGDGQYEEEDLDVMYKGLLSLIGYMVKGFFDESFSRAIIYTDENSINSNTGGTGKSLLLNILSSIVSVTNIDGKNLRENDNYKFHDITGTEQIIAFNDVNYNFDFTQFYNMVTNNVAINKKYGSRFSLSVKNGYCLILNGNQLNNLTNDVSDRRRRIIVELSNFFKPQTHEDPGYTPFDRYGRLLLGNDKDGERDRIAAFLIGALGIQYYLNYRSKYILQVFSDVLSEEKREVQYMDFDAARISELIAKDEQNGYYYISIPMLKEVMSKYTRKKIQTISRDFIEWAKLNGYEPILTKKNEASHLKKINDVVTRVILLRKLDADDDGGNDIEKEIFSIFD